MSDADMIAAAAERLGSREGVGGYSTQPVTAAAAAPMDPVERQPLGTPGEGASPTAASEALLIGAEDAEGSGSGWVLNTMTALGVVLGILLLIRWGYAKLGGKVVGAGGWRGGSGASAVVEVLSRSMIAPRNHVLLLRVGGRVLVVSDSSSGTRTLCEVTDPVEVADLMQAVEASKPTSVSGAFGKVLSGVTAGYEPDASETGGDDGEHRIDRVRDLMSGLQAKLRFTAGTNAGATKGGVA
ncbi:MAG: flagellar biosynthetic protein FliO [Planctomycetota bacterium]